MTTGLFILVDHEPVATDDVLAWATWLGNAEHLVIAKTVVAEVQVSTVFLGSSAVSILSGQPRQLFETMIFELPALTCLTGQQWRYNTYDEALLGHAHVVRSVRASFGLLQVEPPTLS